MTFLNSKNKKYTKQTISYEESQLDLARANETNGTIAADEIEYQLQKAILQLPLKQRTVFNMRYYDEMSYDDISKVLNTSVSALKSSYHWARKKIEECLLEHI